MKNVFLSDGFLARFGADSILVAKRFVYDRVNPGGCFMDVSEDGFAIFLDGEEGNILVVPKSGYTLFHL
jgi:hypothetical protein